jgi:hypothetical protein
MTTRPIPALNPVTTDARKKDTPEVLGRRDPPFCSTNALGLPEINSRVPWVKWVGIPEKLLAGHT